MRPIVVLLLVLILTPPALAKVYRWVDEDGKVHYGDRIPPKYAQQQRQELNERGIVVDEQNRALSEAELAAQRAREDAQREAERQAAEQQRYDEFLLSTYSTQEQILLRRDDQLTILDGRIASAQKSVDQSSATLERLRARAQAKDKVSDKLADQIAQFEQSVQASTAALNKMKQERERVSSEFERDLARFIELTGRR